MTLFLVLNFKFFRLEDAIDIHVIELHAIYRGLLLDRVLHYQDVICYTYSFHFVNILKGSTPIYHKYANLIQDLKDLLSLERSTSITHTLHKGANCVNLLVKLGVSSTFDLLIHTSPPPDL
jgi:hypothetical protein